MELRTIIIICSLFATSAFMQCGAATKVSNTGNYNWNNNAAWVGGIAPVAGDDIIISTNSYITVSSTTPEVGNITVSPGSSLTVGFSPSGNLIYNGDMTVYGLLENRGRIEARGINKIFSLLNYALYIHNPLLITPLDETIFSNSIELFSTNSTVVIHRWFDLY